MPAAPAGVMFLPLPAMRRIPLPAARQPQGPIPAGRHVKNKANLAASALLTAPAATEIFALPTLALTPARLRQFVRILLWAVPTPSARAQPAPAWPIHQLPAQVLVLVTLSAAAAWPTPARRAATAIPAPPAKPSNAAAPAAAE